MKYFVSDIHGEYELFERLIRAINFDKNDEMYVLGDIIDKGKNPIRLAKYISSFPNIRAILGNHEHAFLKYYHTMRERYGDGTHELLSKLRGYFTDGELLDFSIVAWLDRLPSYIEGDGFLCVHAGVPVSIGGALLPIAEASVEELVYDRRFKDPEVWHNSPVCVLFGHTEIGAVRAENKITGYKRAGVGVPSKITDFYKIHLDTGAWRTGVLGCFCADTLRTVYIKREKRQS